MMLYQGVILFKTIYVAEHIEGNKIYCVAINYSATEQKVDFKINNSYKITDIYYGNREIISAFDTLVFVLEKQ